eukprot:TRINITY_DN1662_c0_g1_i2.p1 TRINITY_DN1662_c0_g1~~TRINITY_DN1662_c0_g1_i2.p1  ORF type:complete len:186 (+),score=7.12 TRINITY_DN1662_c0_g1_i2:1168-1725(+)
MYKPVDSDFIFRFIVERHHTFFFLERLVEWRTVDKESCRIVDNFLNKDIPLYVFIIQKNCSGSFTQPVSSLMQYIIGTTPQFVPFLAKRNRWTEKSKNWKAQNSLTFEGVDYQPLISKNYEGSKGNGCLEGQDDRTKSLFDLLSSLKISTTCTTSYCMGWDSACEFTGIKSLSLIQAKEILKKLE